MNIQEPYYGIIIFRPKTQGKNAVKKLFNQFLESFHFEEVKGKKIIIEPNFIRIRF